MAVLPLSVLAVTVLVMGHFVYPSRTQQIHSSGQSNTIDHEEAASTASEYGIEPMPNTTEPSFEVRVNKTSSCSPWYAVAYVDEINVTAKLNHAAMYVLSWYERSSRFFFSWSDSRGELRCEIVASMCTFKTECITCCCFVKDSAVETFLRLPFDTIFSLEHINLTFFAPVLNGFQKTELVPFGIVKDSCGAEDSLFSASHTKHKGMSRMEIILWTLATLCIALSA